MTTPHPQPRPRQIRARWRRARLWIVSISLGLIAFVAGTAGTAWWLIGSEPPWWTALPPTGPGAAAVGQDLENAVVNHLHATRPAGETWSVSISASDANDWLASRLVKWLASREPSIDWSTLHRSVVDFRDGRIFIGAKFLPSSGGDGVVVWGVVIPGIDDQGRLWLRADGVNLGRLPLPMRAFTASPRGLAMRAIPGGIGRTAPARDAAEMLDGKRPLASTPILTLADRRKVRLIGIAAREGRLELTCQTQIP
ncbi:MAG: hypothetical protein JNK70_06825 [Phycisphaerae bacterium]|nr:hypothetical protein [Phycisphaerae bacterium]